MPGITDFLQDKSPRSLTSYIFFDEKLMPCCGKEQRFFNGPRGGLCVNIKCFHCGHRWNICVYNGYIEDIEREIVSSQTGSSNNTEQIQEAK